MTYQIWSFVLFNIFLMAMLALDLGVFHRKSHDVSVREALTWTLVWIAIACAFGVGVYFIEGSQKSLQFFTAYVVEKSLSVDNIFVIYMIFAYFHVPNKFQHKILFWGIIGALVMRAIFIVAGVALITKYHWVIYIFGAFLVYSGIKLMLPKKEELALETNIALKILRKFIRISDNYKSPSFFFRDNGKLTATPLFAALVMVEATDLIFAVDSIPAVLAISTDPFIVYSSNAFAILGMRSLYFAVANLVGNFHYLKLGLSAILIVVGVKMLIADLVDIPTVFALLVVLGVLATSIIASIVRTHRIR